MPCNAASAPILASTQFIPFLYKDFYEMGEIVEFILAERRLSNKKGNRFLALVSPVHIIFWVTIRGM